MEYKDRGSRWWTPSLASQHSVANDFTERPNHGYFTRLGDLDRMWLNRFFPSNRTRHYSKTARPERGNFYLIYMWVPSGAIHGS